MEEILKLYQELRSLFGENDLTMEFSRRIHRIIQETIDRIPDGTRVAIRPAGGDTRGLLKLYDFSGKDIVGIVDQQKRGDDFCGYPCFTMDSFPAKGYDCMIISSLYHRQEIKEDLETLHIPYIDFYDELEKQGFQLHLPHYYCESYIQMAVNYYYLRYLESEAGPRREIALNELLQIAVECKDFTLISNIYQDCGGENGAFLLLKAAWRKSRQLLDCIQNKLQKRKQKDIVLFWTDAVSYDMLHYLPETMKLSKQGAFFQRAYPNTPYTNSTMRAMFCNMLPIDDFPQNQEKIDTGNSPLIRFMENEGYKVRLISDSKMAMGKEHLIAEDNTLSSCNMRWWSGIIDLLQSPEPCFYVFHFLESHPPYYVPDLKDPVIPGKATRMQQETQVKAACGYLDRCVHLYHKLLGNKIQIFFSDHGRNLWKRERWAEEMIHSYCFVWGENIPKITVTRFFPYINFDKFIYWLVDLAYLSLDDVCADEVIIQDTDYYNPEKIDMCIRLNNEKRVIAYRGVLNYDYKYIINAFGEEFFYQRQQDGTERLIPLEDTALRAELRSKAGTAFLNIDRHDKFRHTRKLYEFLKSNEEW